MRFFGANDIMARFQHNVLMNERPSRYSSPVRSAHQPPPHSTHKTGSRSGITVRHIKSVHQHRPVVKRNSRILLTARNKCCTLHTWNQD